MQECAAPTGRFAPSPTGRMHMGNLFTALLGWLSVRSRGGRYVLRIEDLDPQRSRPEYARLIEEDLRWLGLDWDEGGLAGSGPNGPYSQSLRKDFYMGALERLCAAGWVYPCRCTRAELHATEAPHASDGRVIYAGTCRPAGGPPFPAPAVEGQTLRLWVPEVAVDFDDAVFGHRSINLAREWGDMVLRRADGAFAYQLAVVVDDALMGVTEVVRGADLLPSSAPQIYLHRLLEQPRPAFAHVPLLCNHRGIRLSKRDSALSMETLRRTVTPERLAGHLAYLAGIIDRDEDAGAGELIPLFAWDKVKPIPEIHLDSVFQ